MLRSTVFVFHEQAYFDSDQAVLGLMTKDLVEGRAFPMFMYGQRYLLALSVYSSAPFVWLFGLSVASVKFVLLLMNVVVAVLLFVLLRKDSVLPAGPAAVAMLFFAIPPVLASSRLSELGANIDPFIWVLVLWIVRRNPVLLGALGALGVINREFTSYGLAAILILDDRARRGLLISAATFVATTVLLYWVARTFSSNYFGTVIPIAWHFDLSRLAWLLRENLPDLFGLQRVRLADFAIGTRLSEGSWSAGVLLGCGLAVAIVRLAWLRARAAGGTARFPLYLCLVGLVSVAAYVCFAPVVADRMLVRYDLLALLLPCGICALYFARERTRALRAFVMASVVAWSVLNVWSNGRLQVEYLTRPPVNPFRTLVDYLERSKLSVGEAPYWTAYHVTFLSNERIIVAADSTERIPEYREAFQKAERRFHIQDGRCRESGATVMGWCVTTEDRTPQ